MNILKEYNNILKKTTDKIDLFKEMWQEEQYKELYNTKKKQNIEKMIEKYNSTHYIERQMRNYHNMIQAFDEMKTERYSLFI